MNDTLVEMLACLIVGAVLVALGVGFTYWSGAVECASKWQDSGLKSDYGLFSGCRVQRHDGTWVPSSMIREVAP